MEVLSILGLVLLIGFLLLCLYAILARPTSGLGFFFDWWCTWHLLDALGQCCVILFSLLASLFSSDS